MAKIDPQPLILIDVRQTVQHWDPHGPGQAPSPLGRKAAMEFILSGRLFGKASQLSSKSTSLNGAAHD